MKPQETALLLFVGACVLLIVGIVAAGLEQGEPTADSGPSGLTSAVQPTMPAAETKPREHRHPTPTYAIPTADPENYYPGADAVDDE